MRDKFVFDSVKGRYKLNLEWIEGSEDKHENCYADQCLADTAGTPDNECGVANA
jgi:hypothetical protein